MAQLEYDKVKLELTRIKLDQTPIWSEDGCDYLYTHYVFDVIAIVNPNATTFSPISTAPISVAELRSRLLTPRKRLSYIVDGATVLASPHTTYFGIPGIGVAQIPDNVDWVDAYVGPRPISFDVLQWHGVKTCTVRYRIETWLLHCTGTTANPLQPLISHRWEISHEVNELYMTTRRIAGIAKFRSDLLKNPLDRTAPMSADDFRHEFFHPIEDGYKREDIKVAQSSDNTTVRYQVLDVEQPQSWRYDIIKAEGTYTNECYMVPFIPISVPIGRTRTGGNQNSPYISTSVPIPMFKYSIMVRLWGHRNAGRQGMANAAIITISKYISPTGGVGFSIPLHGVLHLDLAGHFVEAQVTYYSPMAIFHAVTGSFTTDLFSKTFEQLAVFRDAAALNTKPIVFPEDFGIHGQHAPNQIPTPGPNWDEHRGRLSLARMVAQALEAPCRVPRAPTNQPAKTINLVR